MKYFAWASSTAHPTFTGPINPRTGKRSQAGSLSAFDWRRDRDRFIEQAKEAAVAVTARQARELKAGLDERAFKALIAVMTGGSGDE